MFSSPTAFATSTSRPWPTIRRVSSRVTGGRPNAARTTPSDSWIAAEASTSVPSRSKTTARGGNGMDAMRSVRDEHDLPDVLVRGHAAMGVGGLGERKRPVHHRYERTVREAGQDVVHEGRRQGRFLLERPAPQGRPDDSQTLGEHHPEVDLGRRAGHARDDDDAASPAETLEVRREERAPDRVENEVDRFLPEGLLDAAQELLTRSVHGEIRAQRHESPALRRAARRRHDGGARALRELDRGGPDPRRARVDERALSRLQATFLKEVQVRGEPGLGDRRGVREREGARNRHEHGPRNGHPLGITPSGEEEEDALAGIFDLARRLESEDFGGTRGRRVLALRLQEVGPVHGRRAHPHDDLAGARHGIRRLAPHERLGSSGFRDEDGFHEPPGRREDKTGDLLRKRRRPGISSKVNRGIDDACRVARSETMAMTSGSFSDSGSRPVAARQTSIFGYGSLRNPSTITTSHSRRPYSPSKKTARAGFSCACRCTALLRPATRIAGSAPAALWRCESLPGTSVSYSWSVCLREPTFKPSFTSASMSFTATVVLPDSCAPVTRTTTGNFFEW